jgi:hypothetical protein
MFCGRTPVLACTFSLCCFGVLNGEYCISKFYKKANTLTNTLESLGPFGTNYLPPNDSVKPIGNKKPATASNGNSRHTFLQQENKPIVAAAVLVLFMRPMECDSSQH